MGVLAICKYFVNELSALSTKNRDRQGAGNDAISAI